MTNYIKLSAHRFAVATAVAFSFFITAGKATERLTKSDSLHLLTINNVCDAGSLRLHAFGKAANIITHTPTQFFLIFPVKPSHDDADSKFDGFSYRTCTLKNFLSQHIMEW